MTAEDDTPPLQQLSSRVQAVGLEIPEFDFPDMSQAKVYGETLGVAKNKLQDSQCTTLEEHSKR